MAKFEVVAEKTFRNEEIERELLAYIVKKKPMIALKILPEWFSSSIYGNVFKILRDVKATVSKAALLNELINRKIIHKGERQIYIDAVEEIYDAHLNGMNDKSAQFNINTLIQMFEGRSILYGIRDIATSLNTLTVEDMKNKLKELGSGTKLPEEIISGDYVAGFDARLKIKA